MTTPAQSRQTKAGRLYPLRPDREVPSVTTILSMISKPALVPAARKVQAEHVLDNLDYYAKLIETKGFAEARMEASRAAKAVWDDTAREGDRLHEALAAIVRGAEPDGYLDDSLLRLKAWLKANTPNVLWSEVTCYNPLHLYAGTVDLIMEIPRGESEFEVVLADLKTGKTVWPETSLQLAALAECKFIRTDDGQEHPMPPIDRCAVLHLGAEKCELVPVKTGPAVFAAFLALRNVWEFQTSIAPTVIG